MAWLPVSGTLPQYTTSGEQADGYVLKFYDAGTTTPKAVSTNTTGSPLTTDFVIDIEGYPTLSAVRVMPFVDSAYKIILYLNQADADADNTGSAVWTLDNLPVFGADNVVISVDNSAELAALDTALYTEALIKGLSAINDGGQGTFYYDSNSTATPDGTDIIEPDSGVGRWIRLPISASSIPPDSVSEANLENGSVTVEKAAWMPFSIVDGLFISNSGDTAHDINISAGKTMNAADTVRIDLGSTIVKQIDLNWSEGSDNGGFPSGLTLSANTWYRVFVISKEDGTTDAGFDTSSSAANLLADATDYLNYRRVGWVVTDGSSDIVRFFGSNNRAYDYSIQIDEGVAVSTAGALVTTTVPPQQVGRFVYGITEISAAVANASGHGLLTRSEQPNSNVSGARYTVFSNSGVVPSASTVQTGGSAIVDLKVSASSQIRHRESTGVFNADLYTLGWQDNLSIL